MTFDEALEYMQGLHRFGIKLGNERFEALLKRLGSPHRAGFGIVHVAGTKGKGSTTAMVASILRAHGFRVGGYFSPYVYDVRERAQVDGEMISREDFARLVTEIRPHAEALAKTDLGPTTEFELKTAIGFSHFQERAVDFAAIEVGIGGRLDATNVVYPDATVITNIGLDHTHILGDTHSLIAAEKAGIIKRGVPCVTAADHPDALKVIERIACEREAPLTRVVMAGLVDREALPAYSASEGGDAHFTVRWADHGGTFRVATPRRTYSGLVCGLKGDYQRVNAACAVVAVEDLAEARAFRVDADAVRAGLARVRMPGRFEIIGRRPTVILDGAHNAMAAEALAREVAKLSFRRLFLVIGMVQGHEPEGVIAPFAPMASRVYATAPTWMKRQPADRIADAARQLGLDTKVVTPPSEALIAALSDAKPQDVVLVTGSFYTVGDIGPELRGRA